LLLEQCLPLLRVRLELVVCILALEQLALTRVQLLLECLLIIGRLLRQILNLSFGLLCLVNLDGQVLLQAADGLFFFKRGLH